MGRHSLLARATGGEAAEAEAKGAGLEGLVPGSEVAAWLTRGECARICMRITQNAFSHYATSKGRTVAVATALHGWPSLANHSCDANMYAL